MDFICFAMRKVTLPWKSSRITDETNAILGDCTALECACPGSLECPFYKTKARLKMERQEAFARIRRLPEYKQLGIAIKYYGGMMPWNDEQEGP